MKKSVFKLNFNLPNDILEDKVINSGIDPDVYEELSECLALEEEFEGNLQQILLVNDRELELIFEILYKVEIQFIFTDITLQVLQSRISFNDEEFQQEIDQFVQDNLTVDIILDKISLYGIKSLTKYEENFLKLS